MEEQEIDLRDYINVILKRKWIIIGIFFVSVITTIVVNLRLPKVYETNMIIENGLLDGEIIKKAEGRELITSSKIAGKL